MTATTDFESGKEDQVRAYLLSRGAQGQLYFKSKYIASDAGLSSKEVGAILNKLRETASDLEIERWGYSRATTWRVEV